MSKEGKADKKVSKKAEKIKEMQESTCPYNQIKKPTNILFNAILFLLGAICVIPFIFVILISFTDEQSLVTYGYSFIPKKWSLDAYQYIISGGSTILKSYGITIFVTIVGTLLTLFLTGTYAYALSRKSYAYRKFFTKLAMVPMLFNGGLVASYMVMTQILHLKNSIWALILPLALGSYNIIILRTFFKTSVPDAVVESAKIDGASEWRLFLQVVIPMSLPGLATIGLFATLGYWNDWYQAMLYIDEPAKMPLQYLLMRLEKNIEFLNANKATLGVTGVEMANAMPKETIKMAIVVISTLPIIFAYPFFQRYFINGLTIGAVKE